MLLLMLIIIIVTVCFCLYKCDDAYTVIYTSGMLSIGTIVAAVTVCTNYFLSSSVLSSSFMYKLIGDFGVSLFDTRNLVNFAIVFLMLSITVFCIKNDAMFSKSVRHLWYIGLFVVASVGIMYFNSNQLAEWIYIVKNDSANEHNISLAAAVVAGINNLIVIAYCIMPVLNIVLNIKRTRLVFRKKYYVAVLLTEMIMLLATALLLYISPLKYFYNNFDIYDFFGIQGRYDYGKNAIYSVALALILFSMIIRNTKYDMVDKKKGRSRKRIVLDFTEIRHVFHTYKNAMFSIRVMADMAASNDNIDDIREILRRIKECAKNYGQHVGLFLDIGNNAKIMNDVFSMTDCIMKAETMHVIPEGIRLVKKLETSDDIIKGNFQEMICVFSNLISNSIDAIKKKNGCNGIINIELWTENDYVCAIVEDNGIGINRKLLKKIFIPLYTTKQTNENWGLGLSHVKSIVERHGGYADVVSKEGSYTRFQFMIPLATE